MLRYTVDRGDAGCVVDVVVAFGGVGGATGGGGPNVCVPPIPVLLPPSLITSKRNENAGRVCGTPSSVQRAALLEPFVRGHPRGFGNGENPPIVVLANG